MVRRLLALMAPLSLAGACSDGNTGDSQLSGAQMTAEDGGDGVGPSSGDDGTSAGSATSGGPGSGADSGPGDTSGPGDDSTTSGQSTGGLDDTGTTGITGTTGSSAGDTGGCNPVCLDVGSPDVGVGPVCGMSNFVATPTPSNVMLVLDASGSMVNVPLWWDHDNDGGTPDISRWRSLHNVVEFIVNTFDANLNLGLQFFPEPGDPKDCTISSTPAVPIAPMSGADIMAALPAKDAYDQLWQNPTPTEDGLQAAIDHIVALGSPLDTAMILVSDGVVSEPCFNYFDDTLALIDDAYRNLGIPTYVVGIAISAANRAGYDQWAVAGGVPLSGSTKYYDVRNEIELQAALQQISGLELGCSGPLSPPPPDPNMVQVQLNGNLVLPATNCGTDDGWVYTNPAGPYDGVELCGSWCDTFKAGGGEVLALYGCPPEG